MPTTIKSGHRVTSFDVAERAGVNQSTVSRALSGDPSITESTRDRVRRAADELGYRIDSRAARLRSGRTRTIAIIVITRPDLEPTEINPFVPELELQSRTLMATSRMHCSLLSLLHGVPVVSVDQIRGGAKVSRLVSKTGWPVLRADRDGPAEVADLVRRIRAGEMDETLLRARERMIACSREALDDAVEMITATL